MKNNSNSYLTVLTILFGFTLLNIFLKNEYITYLILILSGTSVFSNKLSVLIDLLWFKIAAILSKIIPNILLSVIFFFLLTPLSLLSKLFKSKTDFKTLNSNDSNYISIEKSFNKKSFERTW